MRRVVIAEDQAIAREALRLVLEREGYDVAGEAEEGLEAMRLLRAQRPDLLVLGLRLRRLNGIEVIRRAHRVLPSIKMLVVSEIDNPLTVSQCESAGASGFVSKTGDFSEFLLALQAIDHGRNWFPAQMNRSASANSDDAQNSGSLGVLSLREQSVLRYLAQGYRVRDIAAEMALNERTISTYKARLLRKLNARSVVELADIARRYRLAPQTEVPEDGATRSMGEAPVTSPDRNVHALLDLLPFSVTMRALDGRVMFANRYLRSHIGSQQFEIYRQVGLREQARLFGADETSAERIEATFVAAVARGSDYRLHVVAEFRGELTVGVQWGVPLADEHGVISLMICGTFNVNGAERLMVDLHEEMAAALSASEARSMLVEMHGDDVSVPLAKAIELLDTASGHKKEATADLLAEARSQVQVAALRLGHLRLLGAMGTKPPESAAVRCDLREVTRRVVQTVENDMAMFDTRFALSFAGRGSDAVWLDAMRYGQLLEALLYRAANAPGAGDIPVTVRGALHGGGMVDIELRIGQGNAAGETGNPQLPEADTAGAQLELALCRNIARALRGDLTVNEADTAGAAVLKLTLPRGAEIA